MMKRAGNRLSSRSTGRGKRPLARQRKRRPQNRHRFLPRPCNERMVSGFIAEHREGRASARPRASRRLPLPAVVTPPPQKPLRLCVSALKNAQLLNPKSYLPTPRAAVLCLVLASAGLLYGAPPAPTITFLTDRPSAVYACGEETTVTLRINDAQGGLLKTGTVSFTVDNFGTNRLAVQKLTLARDNPFVWRGTLHHPGFLRCRAALDGQKLVKPVVYGIAFDPCGIRLGSGGRRRTSTPTGAVRSRAGSEVPLDARVTRLASACTAATEVSRVSFATFNGKRVHGVLSVPADRSRGPFPVRVTVPWAGPGAHAPETRPDDDRVITLVINIHDFEPGPDAATQRRKYDEQNRRYADDVAGIKLRSAYENHRYAGYTDRTTYFYHDPSGASAARCCGLSVPSRPHARGLFRRSQGGMGMMLTALTPVFSRAFASPPWPTCSPAVGRRAGWPMLMERAHRRPRGSGGHCGVYDAGHFASRVQCECRVLIGFADEACPPPSVYAAYNELRGPKTILHDVGVPHSNPPSYLQNQAWILELPTQATPKKVTP